MLWRCVWADTNTTTGRRVEGSGACVRGCSGTPAPSCSWGPGRAVGDLSSRSHSNAAAPGNHPHLKHRKLRWPGRGPSSQSLSQGMPGSCREDQHPAAHQGSSPGQLTRAAHQGSVPASEKHGRDLEGSDGSNVSIGPIRAAPSGWSWGLIFGPKVVQGELR
ncbi:hypothetical protein P154DRAFT_572342 [Amniculicola lignicola CBS 123094]|uniref:Uncharacterized protein n=1 Tax=Amniculicola lignicola CBS 123094 TaxID=1392246 RepID=A0A6A5WU99_9PLEO|nr:hypothetical protein P154DRAFT_572342 [Amniculicola lignicola CBS 123094]